MLQDSGTLRKEVSLRRNQATRDELAALVDELLLRWEREREETNRRLTRLTDNLQTLDARLLTVENSRVFRALQSVTAYLKSWGVKSTRYVRPAHAEAHERRAYQLWQERQRLQRPADTWFRETIYGFGYAPRFSLLLHVDRPRRDQLTACVDSVRSQSYPHWELSVCDDATPDPSIAQYFRDLAARDPRVQYVRSEQVMGEASSLNRAGMLGAGDYVCCTGQHDRLAPDALFYLAQALQTQRYDLVYGDEDSLSGVGLNERPRFKPGWSPDLLLSTMYLGRFFAVARVRLNALDWFNRELDGAHLGDLALRLAERQASARHLPKILYHAAGDGSVPAPGDHEKAVQSALQRRGWKATIEEASGMGLTIRRKLSGTPLASIIICSRNPSLLKSCLNAIDNLTAYPVRETVVVQHKTGDDAAMERLLARSHCVRVVHAGPFDFASMNNRGAQAANGEVLVFLNDDVEPLSADWLKELLAQVQRPEVGVVGAKLLYPSGALQHAGIALGLMDGAGHPQRGTFGQGFWPWVSVTRNVAAVTGACLAIRRRVFEELSGFDARFPVNYNDVDLCLRARQAGYEVICETSAVLRHLESKTRVQGVTWQERELFHERWGSVLQQGDPYYNSNLTRTKEDCSLNLD